MTNESTETDEYGFMAVKEDDHRFAVSDNQGGGARFAAYSKQDFIDEVKTYMQRCLDVFAEEMAGEFDWPDDECVSAPSEVKA